MASTAPFSEVWPPLHHLVKYGLHCTI